MDIALIHALLALGGLTGGVALFAADVYAWYTGPWWQAFSLTCLGDVLHPLLGDLNLKTVPAGVQGVLAAAEVIPLSLLLLALGWCGWQMALHMAEESERGREEWHQYLSRRPRQ